MSGGAPAGERGEALLRSQHRCVDCSEKLGYHEINTRVRRCEDCREHAAEDRALRNERILKLNSLHTMTARDIAVAVDCPIYVVRHIILTARRAPASPRVSARRALPRCRCGLLEPCNSCVPTIQEFASMRRGESAV